MAYLSSFTKYKSSKSEFPWHWLFKVNKVKCNHTNGLPICAFLLMFNSNIWPKSYGLFARYNASKTEWHWLWPLNVTQGHMWQCHWTPIYGFPLLFNSNICPILAPLRDIGFQNLSDIDTDLSRSLRSNVIASMDSPYMLPYLCLIVTYGLTPLLYKI